MVTIVRCFLSCPTNIVSDGFLFEGLTRKVVDWLFWPTKAIWSTSGSIQVSIYPKDIWSESANRSAKRMKRQWKRESMLMILEGLQKKEKENFLDFPISSIVKWMGNTSLILFWRKGKKDIFVVCVVAWITKYLILSGHILVPMHSETSNHEPLRLWISQPKLTILPFLRVSKKSIHHNRPKPNHVVVCDGQNPNGKDKANHRRIIASLWYLYGFTSL